MRIMAGFAIAIVFCTGALAASAPITPGEWEITVVINSAEMPNVPAAAMQAMVGQSHTITDCVTEEDAKKGPQELVRQSGGDCQFTTYSMEGGKLDAAMQCTQGGRTTTVTTTGTFTSDSYSAKSDMAMTGGMKMSSAVSGKRVGACKS